MKKDYIVEFTHNTGGIERVTFHTDDIKWSVKQYCRNRHIVSHRVLEEGAVIHKGGLLLD